MYPTARGLLFASTAMLVWVRSAKATVRIKDPIIFY